MDTKRRPSHRRWVLPAILVILILAAILTAYFYIPGASGLRVGEGDIILSMEDEHTVLLTWPEVPDKAHSRVSLHSGSEKELQLLGEFDGNSTELDATLLEQPLEIRIQAVTQGKNLLGMERQLISRNALEVSVQPYAALRPDLEGAGGGAGELNLSWDGRGSYELGILEDGQYRAIQEVTGDTATLRFGENGDLPMPGYDQPARITLRTIRQGEGYVLYGPCVTPLEVKREALLGSSLSLECQQVGERQYVLRWNEAKGDHYEVQEWSAARNQWETLARVDRDAELRYETGLLRSGSDHRYQVVSVGGDPEEPVEPAGVSLRAEISTRYATVWPVIQVECYEDAGLTKSLGKVPAGMALCVLEEQGNAFQVRFRDQYVWVDNRFCMIDLPEYVGDVCAYDITNSYSSIFMVHDNPIQYITGQVVQGFEGVSTAEDGFLVPYLYPCAKKLLTAAQAAEKDGYRLRIYEAFRPNEATRFLYDTTEVQLDYPVPELDPETNEYIFYEPPAEPVVDPETGFLMDPETGLPILDPETGLPVMASAPENPDEPLDGEPQLPEDESGLQPETADPVEPSQEEPQKEPQEDVQTESLGGAWEPTPAGPDEPDKASEEEPKVEFTGPTFREIMTDSGRWRLGSFLAAVASAHNRGIALDLTIEYLDGRPLEMQSAMHDLSWYSATYLNNENAKLLESYMTMPGVEMRGLTSEWWHFQDDDTREAIGLNSYLVKGVTAEGWTRDNTGWRYRDAKGNYARSTTLKIDGTRYTFDADGYAVE